MLLDSLHVRNYRRLKDVVIQLEKENTVFVGANNSGKTSATHVLRSFLQPQGPSLTLHDFSADAWRLFDRIGNAVISEGTSADPLPVISLDLWFRIEESDLHRVVALLPSLEWSSQPVGIRLQFAARESETLFAEFRAAHRLAREIAGNGDEQYRPWPISFSDYLERKLETHFEVSYFVLDHGGLEETGEQTEDSIYPLDSKLGQTVVKSLLTVHFLDAQRNISDTKSGVLSRRLGSYYKNNLAQFESDLEALATLDSSERSFNEHLAGVFQPMLMDLNELGYPGLDDPGLTIRSTFSVENIIASQDTTVHYALHGIEVEDGHTPRSLPEKYNGLGFKNLIFMAVEILDFQARWKAQDSARTPLHIIVIEEPEAHLHTQLQQVFIRKIREVITRGEVDGFTTQLIVTTHSPHIINESDFTPIRYFQRTSTSSGTSSTKVKNLSDLNKISESERDFLHKYMRLTHCDLFFADAAVLVEGNVERLLLPAMIDKKAPALTSRYLTILEVGGAFAHRFEPLINLLGIATLIITDLDSVTDSPTGDNSAVADPEENEMPDRSRPSACLADAPMATTANQTLRHWLPSERTIKSLVDVDQEKRTIKYGDDARAQIRIAYQMPVEFEWGEERAFRTGRTFEEAFAFENLLWLSDANQSHVVSNPVRKADSNLDLPQLVEKIHTRVRMNGFKKTEFALSIMASDGNWAVPTYIIEGLEWLAEVIAHTEPTGDTTSGAEDILKATAG